MATTANKIIQLCEKYWEKNKANCSGFVKDIATALGVSVNGQANDIVDQIQLPPWTILDSGVNAAMKATNGYFVVAGLKAKKNGHVVVVVPGPLAKGKYPTAYWGSLGGVPKKNTTLNWSWNRSDADCVIYSCISVK